MKKTNSDANSNPAIPFIGRANEVGQLAALHAQRKHVLLLGDEGVGKTALVQRVRSTLRLILSSRSTAVGEISDSLEAQLGICAGRLSLAQRKQILLKRIAAPEIPIVFDGVEWTTPKLSSFFQGVSERVPVWICTRSEHPWDIGHFWPLLARFERVELRPFTLRETRSLVAAAVGRTFVSEEALEIVGWLHRTSAGNPGRLCKLLMELANGHYDVRNSRSLRLLKLDYHIHDIFPARVQDRGTKGLA